MIKSIAFWCLLICTSCTVKVDSESSTDRYKNIKEGRYNAAFLIMDGTFNTELTAPYDIFHHTIFRDSIKPMNVFMVANTLNPITTFEGIKLLPNFNYLVDSLPPIDILVVPSAEGHLDKDLRDTLMLNFVKSTAQSAQFVTSHCDGAFVLAEAGLLDNIESTTFPGDITTYRERYPSQVIHDSVLFVHDGKFITSAGGAKSFEAALYLCEILYGKTVADQLAEGLVIEWELEDISHIIAK